jgi:hypothetical protein
LEVIEDKLPKLVRVPKFDGIVSYWGLATHGPDWNTLDWLRREANGAGSHNSAENFANHLASSLSAALSHRKYASPLDIGMGLHFTAYERITGYWVPELFLIRNWGDDSCTSIRPGGFEVRRELYGATNNTMQREQSDGTEERRLATHSHLQNGGNYTFANGDPVLFNIVARATFGVLNQLASRGLSVVPSSRLSHLDMVRRPVEFIAKLLQDFARPDTRRVGGKPHDLAVQPGGLYESTTGD